MMTQDELNKVQGFFGTLMLKEWWQVQGLPGEQHNNYQQLCGFIRVIDGKAGFGFTPRGGQETWFVAVSGSTETIYVLACQVRGAHQHAEDKALDPAQTYRVP